MKKGESSRFSTPMRRTEGGDGDVFLDKSSKKEKLRRLSCVGVLGEMNQLSHSVSTNSTTKRVKLPNKFSDNYHMINHATAPRKQRSAMKKRPHESQKGRETTVSKVFLGSRNEIGVQLKDNSKTHQNAADNNEDSNIPPRDSMLTKDEEEVAEALFAMAQACNVDHAGTSEDKSNATKSRNRCSSHIYICRFIKELQTTEIKAFGVIEGSKQEDIDRRLDASSRPKAGDFPEVQDLLGLHLTNTRNHHSDPAVKQVIYLKETAKDLMGCSLETFGLKYTQVVGSEKKGKMVLSDGSSGYEKRSLFFVDSGPKLELTL